MKGSAGPRRARGRRGTGVAAILAVLVACPACSAWGGGPPRLGAYGLPTGTSPWRLGLAVDGTVDVGGPNDTSALSQMMPTSGLKASARMRLEYDQDTSATGDAGRRVEMHATAVSGRFESFVANRDFGVGDLGVFGNDGTVMLELGPDGTLRNAGGSPLGGMGLPLVADVLTGWPCPPLPDGGVEAGTSWPASVLTPGGTRLSGTASYEPGELAGRHVLEVSAELEGDTAAHGVELEKMVTTVTGADLPDLHLSPMNLRAHSRTRNRCRLDADDRSLVSWSVDSNLEVTLQATTNAKYDAILDGTTMSFDISATATPL